MKSSRKLLSALALCLVLGAPAAASEVDQGPGSNPKVEGPVLQDNSQCSEQPVKGDSGDVLGRAETCIYLYSFDTLSETDVLREYGAVWLQARFVPAEGWCATDVGTRLELDGGQIEGTTKAPRETGAKVTTKLKLTAGGNALEDGAISQRWAAAPGDITTKSGEGHGVSSVWSGETSKPVNLVSGVSYSYEMLGAGPENIAFGFSKFSLVSC